jgi:HlyD family secretion protein
VIIDRRVNIGQTVVASLNAPSLFLIATDLRKLEVWVSVNEADIGKIRDGQPVTFTVDAFPGEQFKGTVSKVRLNAQMTQNVVTYTVEVTTDNDTLRLVPYLTASVRFEVDRRDDALLVPTAALRFQPKPEQMTTDARAEAEKAGAATPSGGGGEPRRRRREGGGEAPATAPSGPRYTPGTLWVLDGSLVKPVKVRAGLSDGVQTEVIGEALSDGMDVVVGEVLPKDQTASGAPNTNPFGPPQFGRRPGGGAGGTGGGGARPAGGR